MGIIATGSQACTIGTEHNLIDTTTDTPCSATLDLDLNALADGDILEIRAYTLVGSGGTQRQLKVWTVPHAQADPNWQSPPFRFSRRIRWTIKQTLGTGRTIPYDVDKL